MQSSYFHELNFCLQLREKEGSCTFGGGTKCEQCAVPYLYENFSPEKLSMETSKD